MIEGPRKFCDLGPQDEALEGSSILPTDGSKDSTPPRDRVLSFSLAGLPGDRQGDLIATLPLLTVPAGTVLFDARQPCRGFPLLLKGAVGVWKTAPGGREILLYRVEPGDGCILSGDCLLGQDDYAATGIAESDVTLMSLPPEAFQTLLLEHEPFRRFVFGLYGARLAEMMDLVEEVAFRQLDQRLARLGDRCHRRRPALRADFLQVFQLNCRGRS